MSLARQDCADVEISVDLVICNDVKQLQTVVLLDNNMHHYVESKKGVPVSPLYS